jgi:hypothetical protein
MILTILHLFESLLLCHPGRIQRDLKRGKTHPAVGLVRKGRVQPERGRAERIQGRELERHVGLGHRVLVQEPGMMNELVAIGSLKAR